MYTTSKRICHVHPFLQRVPHIFDHTPTLEQLVLLLRHHPFHVLPRRDIQQFLRLEEPYQFLLLQQIPRITHEDTFEIHDQVSQCSIVMHVPRDKEDVLQIPHAVTHPMQLESEEPPLRRLPTTCYLFRYSILIYIMVLAYRYIRGVYKMLLVSSTVHMKQVLHQQADEQSRTVRRLQKVLIVRQLWEIPFVVCLYNSMKSLQVLHSHREAQQVQGHHLSQCQLLFGPPSVFPEMSEPLPDGRMKKSLKKVINECIKNSKFFIIHTQPPWILDLVNPFIPYPQEVVKLEIRSIYKLH